MASEVVMDPAAQIARLRRNLERANANNAALRKSLSGALIWSATPGPTGPWFWSKLTKYGENPAP
jgi:hypothetical protein